MAESVLRDNKGRIKRPLMRFITLADLYHPLGMSKSDAVMPSSLNLDDTFDTERDAALVYIAGFGLAAVERHNNKRSAVITAAGVHYFEAFVRSLDTLNSRRNGGDEAQYENDKICEIMDLIGRISGKVTSDADKAAFESITNKWIKHEASLEYPAPPPTPVYDLSSD
ncbi:MAG: hypothetical protein MPK62_01410 [Alphaproteobacteria bacterium]|nr:hypothetical protein [Alphaproteobacteria bacterium]MDA8029792.1 hypothetical protein [Alphaproteobacteria bacterium]